jgi:peptide/nickel transport system ATP-binding protein
MRSLRIEQVREGGNRTIVRSMSLAVAAGETIGIVGESGSGKSLTARAITGLLAPNLVASGEALYLGRNLLTLKERDWRSIRGREIGLIMQDPFTTLNPVFRCGRTIDESLTPEQRSQLGKSGRKKEVARRLAEVGIVDERVRDRYPFQLSGGMRQRVGIAAALARDPKILIADEPSTALDVSTQQEILNLLRAIQQARRMSLILITHDLRVAFSNCDRIYVLYAGSLVEVSGAKELDAEPLHPYSHGLLLSEPPAHRRVREMVAIPGSVPTADEVAGCCTFAPRCRWAEPICHHGQPPLRAVAPGRLSACIRVDEVRGELATLRKTAEITAPAALMPPNEAQDEMAALRRTTESTPTVHARAADASLIDVRDARKVFGNGKHRMEALQGVSLQVGEKESVGLVGESGSGKTTLARILVGLETASAGEILIDGIDARSWTRLSRHDQQKLRRVVQIIFQDPYSSLNPMRTVGAAVREAIITHQSRAKNVSDQVKDLLISVGLPASYAERRPVTLSGGERQRVAIARALAVNPRVLVCDEPVSALDVSVQAQILNLFSKLREDRGLGYLFITHDLAVVRQVVDRIYVMYRGEIVESGEVDEVLTNPRDPYTIKLLEAIPRAPSEVADKAGSEALALS